MDRLGLHDDTDANQNYIKAYVDGRPVAVTLTPQGGGSLTNVPDNFLDFTRDPVFGKWHVHCTTFRQVDARRTLC